MEASEAADQAETKKTPKRLPFLGTQEAGGSSRQFIAGVMASVRTKAVPRRDFSCSVVFDTAFGPGARSTGSGEASMCHTVPAVVSTVLGGTI